MAQERAFPSPDLLAEALAGMVAERLRARLEGGGRAAIALSGGRTPALFMRTLAGAALDWSRVDVTLVDERWVDETSPRSNAALLRDALVRDRAAALTFLPLYRAGDSPENERGAVEAMIAGLPRPFAATVLGMGEDGHTASFFLGGDRLAQALDPAGTRLVESMRAPGAGEPRITLTLPAILASDAIALHVEGAAKMEVLARALQPGPASAMPVRAVLHQTQTPVTIFRTP